MDVLTASRRIRIFQTLISGSQPVGRFFARGTWILFYQNLKYLFFKKSLENVNA